MTKPVNADYRAFVEAQFSSAAFIQHLGIELVDFGPGWCATRIALRPEHFQQDGFAHAGVVTTLADHSCGMAAGTLAPAGRLVLTVEFKVNLLRPATSPSIACRAEVVKSGRQLSVVQATARESGGDTHRELAIMTATMALVDAP